MKTTHLISKARLRLLAFAMIAGGFFLLVMAIAIRMTMPEAPPWLAWMVVGVAVLESLFGVMLLIKKGLSP